MTNVLRILGIGTLAAILAGCAGLSDTPETAEVNETTEETLEAEATAETTESAPAATPKASAPSAPGPSRTAPAPVPQPVTIPAGTSFSVILVDSIQTGVNEAGDVFLASLASAMSVDGNVVFEKGTMVRGRIAEAEGSGRVSGRARIRLQLTEIMPGNRSIPISTEPFIQVAESDPGRDAKIGAVGATIGGVVGGLTGGTKGAVIGATAGGAGSVAATKGQELSYPSESSLTFTVDRPVEVPPAGSQTTS